MSKHDDWLEWLEEEKKKDYYKEILKEVALLDKKEFVTPDPEFRLRALEFENIEDIMVIITDVQPMPDSHAADGLALSALDEATPRMQEVYKTLYNELGVIYDQGDNSKDRWAEQGVLLLNRELTRPESSPIKKPKPKRIWSPFTQRVLEYFINDSQKRIFVYLDPSAQWNPRENPHKHPIIMPFDRRTEEVKPFFQKVNNFVCCHYNVYIDWS